MFQFFNHSAWASIEFLRNGKRFDFKSKVLRHLSTIELLSSPFTQIGSPKDIYADNWGQVSTLKDARFNFSHCTSSFTINWSSCKRDIVTFFWWSCHAKCSEGGLNRPFYLFLPIKLDTVSKSCHMWKVCQP